MKISRVDVDYTMTGTSQMGLWKNMIWDWSKYPSLQHFESYLLAAYPFVDTVHVVEKEVYENGCAQMELFRHMCERHDTTYMYSDDHGMYRRGEDEYKKIRAAAKSVPNAAEIWNAVIDNKMVDPYRKQFYWKEKD